MNCDKCSEEPPKVLLLDLYGFGKLALSKTSRSPRIPLRDLITHIPSTTSTHLSLPESEDASPPDYNIHIKGENLNLLCNRIVIADMITRYLKKARLPKMCLNSPSFNKLFTNIKKIGKGKFGTVYSAKYKVKNSYLDLAIKESKLTSKEIRKLRYQMYPKEYLYNVMVNEILRSKASPNFNFTYSITFCNSQGMRSLTMNELQYTDLTNWCSYAKDKRKTMEQAQFSLHFQILQAVYCLQKEYGIFHSNICTDNILIRMIPYAPNQCWEYIVGTHTYYVPNMGAIAFLSDFALAYNLRPSPNTSYYGTINAEVVQTSKGPKWKPFSTKWFPYIKDGLVKAIPSPLIQGDKNLTINRFVKGFNSIPSVNVDIGNFSRFPPFEFYSDIQDTLLMFIGGKKHKMMKNLTPGVEKTLKLYKGCIDIDTEWSDDDIPLFYPEEILDFIYGSKYSLPIGTILEVYQI